LDESNHGTLTNTVSSIQAHFLQNLGYQRKLQVTDLWKVHETQAAAVLSADLDRAWQRRVTAADEWNRLLDTGSMGPPLHKRVIWSLKASFGRGTYKSFLDEWRTGSGRSVASLTMALNDVLGRFFWTGALFKVRRNELSQSGVLICPQVFGDLTQLMTPLLLKVRNRVESA
jgi:hypothetical protein